MSWFSSNNKNKNMNVQESDHQKAVALQKAQQIEWIDSQATSDFIELFNNFEAQMKSVTQEPSELTGIDKDSYRAAMDSFAQIRKTFFEIDKSLLSEYQVVSLYEILSKTTPQIINQFQSSAIASGIHAAWSYAGGARQPFANLFKSLAAMRTSQIGIVPTAASKLETLSTSNFPQYNVTDTAIADSLTRIGKLWTQASEKKNTIEDEYFLEQVVSSYLPEAYRLYSTFQLAPIELHVPAATIFIEQLELIERHLVHILRTYMEQNLVAMQNHMDFLKQKTLNSAEKPELLEIAAT
jgi:hypothetical protein